MGARCFLSNTTNSDQSNTAETVAGRRTEIAWNDPGESVRPFPIKKRQAHGWGQVSKSSDLEWVTDTEGDHVKRLAREV